MQSSMSFFIIYAVKKNSHLKKFKKIEKTFKKGVDKVGEVC